MAQWLIAAILIEIKQSGQYDDDYSLCRRVACRFSACERNALAKLIMLALERERGEVMITDRNLLPR